GPEGGVEDLLYLGVETVDLVDEDDLPRLEGGEERGQVPRALDDRTRGGLDRRFQLGGDDVGERRLADAGRPEEQHVVEGLAAAAGGLDGHPEIGHHLRLPDVLVERAGPQRLVEAEVVVVGTGGDEARVKHRRASASSSRYDLQGPPQQVLETARAVLPQRAVDTSFHLASRIA